MSNNQERLGFFNTRLEKRMVESNVTARELAVRVGITYEHVRKLLRGLCLPSASTLEKLCSAISMNKKEMQENVSRDKMIYRYGDAAWRAAGIDPTAAPLYILLPLLSDDESAFFIRQIRLLAAARRSFKKSGESEALMRDGL